jgi:hypothetical protein
MSQHDQLDELAIRDMWWEQGEAVMKEMCEEDEGEEE